MNAIVDTSLSFLSTFIQTGTGRQSNPHELDFMEGPHTGLFAEYRGRLEARAIHTFRMFFFVCCRVSW